MGHSGSRCPRHFVGPFGVQESLVREESEEGVVRFLRDLGAAVSPRVHQRERDARHSGYSFIRATRGDLQRDPHFPHSMVRFGSYTDTGFERDFHSPDLDAWWDHVSALGLRERRRRGEALQRVFEQHWESTYQHVSRAVACGYRRNARTNIGRVPARWLWDLQHRNWVRTDSGSFQSPDSTVARTPEIISRIRSSRLPLSSWDANSKSIARDLGFIVEMPREAVIAQFQADRTASVSIPAESARADYEQLSAGPLDEKLRRAFAEGLVFSAREGRWRTPAECLRTDESETLGDLVGSVSDYPSAAPLWDFLEIPEKADITFLRHLWDRLAAAGDLPRGLGDTALTRSFQLAEELLEEQTEAATIPVPADGTWRNSDEVFFTENDELAWALEAEGLFRWDLVATGVQPRFFRWAGVINIHDDAETSVHTSPLLPSDSAATWVHAAVGNLIVELHESDPRLHVKLRERLTAVCSGLLEVRDSLRLRVALEHPRIGRWSTIVPAAAHRQGGDLFLSGTTAPDDDEVAAAILSQLPLSREERYAAMNALSINLMRRPSGMPVIPAEALRLPIDEDRAMADTEKHPDQSEPDPPDEELPQRRPKRSAPERPVNGFWVSADEGSELSSEPGGGPVTRATTRLRPPGGSGGSGGHKRAGDSPDPKSTEQRAVELYRRFVLEPDGIGVTDQRLRPNVGADLVGTDGVFRELKSHGASAPSALSLTRHEYVRAGQKGDHYQLVVVEHVWGDSPVITIVGNPLVQLHYAPSGAVLVEGWKGEGLGRRIQLEPETGSGSV